MAAVRILDLRSVSVCPEKFPHDFSLGALKMTKNLCYRFHSSSGNVPIEKLKALCHITLTFFGTWTSAQIFSLTFISGNILELSED